MDSRKLNINNKKAYHDYFVMNTLECGIVLHGNEVKSIKSGNASIKEAWCDIKDNQLIIHCMHISPWHTTNNFDINEKRDRILLAHKKEIQKLFHKKQETGITLIPLQIIYKHNHIKIVVGVCKGKKLYDKRQSLKEKQTNRDINHHMKQTRR